MPENKPLLGLAGLELVLEAEVVVRVVVADEVEKDGGGLEDGEGGGLVVVDEDGDAAVGVETEEPLLLLLVSGDVAAVMSVCCSDELEVWERGSNGHHSSGELETIFVLELLKQDLDLLAVGGALGHQVEALFRELQSVS